MWFVDAAARGAGTAYSAFVPGEQFTRGAGVSRKRCSGRNATRSDSEAAVLFCGLSAVLVRACGAAKLCSERQRFGTTNHCGRRVARRNAAGLAALPHHHGLIERH